MLKQLLLVIAILSSFLVQSQCSETLLPVVTEKLNDFAFVKDFKIKLREVKSPRDRGKVTIPIMLNKETTYRFALDDDKGLEGRLIFELFSDKRGRQVSSYEPVVKKHYNLLEYKCNHSGIYYLNFEFVDAKGGCGVMVYGFKKNE